MDFKALLHQISQIYQKLSLKQKIVAGSSIVLGVAFLVFLTLYKSKSDSFAGYSVLFENISPSDSALIVDQLNKDGIKYKLANEGTILVPTSDVYKERIAVATLGIPKESKIGFEIFDKQEFGATDAEQRVKFQRALEGELARTIESLSSIQKATVRIAIPKESVFTERQALPTASIVVELKPGVSLNAKQIFGIKNLVAASVTNLSTENVKIVNQDGVALGGMRVGYGVANEEIIGALSKLRAPFNITTPSLRAAIVALGDDEFVQKTMQNNFEQMKRYEEFARQNGIEFIPSYTNFITFKFNEPKSSQICEKMLKKGIILRDLKSYALNAVRITIGQAWQNDRVFEELKQILK